MHSFDSNSSNVPAFLVKLWKLVEDSSCNDLIAWSTNGLSFIIRNQARFAREMLPQYFKHNNMASFIRQLNMYGFRKVMNYEKSGLRNENDEMEFQHNYFVKGQEEFLESIKRKIPNTKIAEPTVKSNAKDILTDLTSIREKQESMDNMLIKMKQENELLWRELTSMRQKHKAQEQIIQKVIQFLVSIVQRSNTGNNIGVQRKMLRMLHDSPGNKVKSSPVAGTIEVLRKKSPDCIIAVPQDKIVSPLGPVIHEVVDFEETHNSFSDPVIKSPTEATDNSDSECPLDSSLNSPMNTPVAMEPLSILEPLHPRIPALTADDCSAGESILGIPLEYITIQTHDGTENIVAIPEVSNIISIPEDSTNNSELSENSVSNVISVPENSVSNVISIPENSLSNVISIPENSLSNVISIPEDDTSNIVDACETVLQPGTSFCLSPQSILVYSPHPKNEIDTILTESLQTPKIHIEDVSNPPYEESKVQHKRNKRSIDEDSPEQNYLRNQNNYQLAVSDSSTVMKPSTLTKNSLSNHLLNVEEELNWLQDHIASNSWNIDASKLLGLFSTDDVANNESLADQIAADSNMKNDANDIVGNELVQFIPSMLDVELDIQNSPFLEYIYQDAEVPIADISNISNDQKDNLVALAVNDSVDQASASEAAEFLLNNGNVLKHNSSRRHKTPKAQKSKRRKLK